MTQLQVTIDLPKSVLTTLSKTSYSQTKQRQEALRNVQISGENEASTLLANHLRLALNPLDYMAIEQGPFVAYLKDHLLERLKAVPSDVKTATFHDSFGLIGAVFGPNNSVNRNLFDLPNAEACRLLVSYRGQFTRPRSEEAIHMDPLDQPNDYLTWVFRDMSAGFISRLVTQDQWIAGVTTADIQATLKATTESQLKTYVYG